jgi:hypothetical protein
MDLKELVKPELYVWCAALLPALQTVYNVFDPDDGVVSKKVFAGYLLACLGLGMGMAYAFSYYSGSGAGLGPSEAWPFQGLGCTILLIVGNRIMKAVYGSVKTKTPTWARLNPVNRGGGPLGS